MRRRILVSYISLTLFVLLVLEIPLGLFFADRERDRFTNAVLSDAGVLASLFEDALDQGDPIDPLAIDQVSSYAESTDARVLVVDERGTSLVDTASAVGRNFSSRPEIATALAGERAAGARYSNTLGEDLLVVAVPIASGGQVHGAARLSLPLSDVDERVDRFWLGLGAMGALVLVAVSGIGWAVASSMTSPVRALQESAKAFGDGDLAPRPAPHGAPAEVRALSDALNAMAARLRHAIDEQRAFVADASHQLRTPLTALRLRLENVQSEGLPSQSADLEAAHAEIDRLALLVEQLLHLARSERLRERIRVDARQVTVDRVDTWSAVAEARSIALTAAVPVEPLGVELLPDALEQILDNLIDNALQASADGAQVELRVGATGTTVIVEVIDHGIGLSGDEKARALDRFWRGTRSGQGTGLGLSIVQALATAHKGSVELVDTPGGGLTVRVLLAAG